MRKPLPVEFDPPHGWLTKADQDRRERMLLWHALFTWRQDAPLFVRSRRAANIEPVRALIDRHHKYEAGL